MRFTQYFALFSVLLVGGCMVLAVVNSTSNSNARHSPKNTKIFTKAEMGADWPFSDYDSAEVGCIKHKYEGVEITRPLAYVELDGARYGLNGAGMKWWPSVNDLMPRDPYYDSYDVNAMNGRGAMLKAALKICGYDGGY